MISAVICATVTVSITMIADFVVECLIKNRKKEQSDSPIPVVQPNSEALTVDRPQRRSGTSGRRKRPGAQPRSPAQKLGKLPEILFCYRFNDLEIRDFPQFPPKNLSEPAN